jgi:hypothetical protein
MNNRRNIVAVLLVSGFWNGGSFALAADASPPTPAAIPDIAPPQVAPAAPGVFNVQKRASGRFRLSVTGHSFTSREAIENYLAYRAAELAKEQHADWFSLIEQRGKGDKAPLPKSDPAGPRFSFRMEYWHPAWRYQTKAAPAWKRWSPFSGTPFFATDPKDVSAYEVSADIVLHKGTVAATNPLAFDADALSDFLVNQVTPPQ